jgi:cytochrome c oxidase cbb3-type subunit 3
MRMDWQHVLARRMARARAAAMNILLMAVLIAFIPPLAYAADPPSLNGNWQVHVTIGDYDNQIVCSFTQSGQALTGTCDTEAGPSQITGTVSGAKITWSYRTDYNGSAVTPSYEGTWDMASKITGTVTVPELNASGDFTATQQPVQNPPAAPPAAAPPESPQAAPARSAVPIDREAAARGQQLFIQNCSFCHGPDARGGAEGGADLTRSAIVNADPSAAQLIAFLKTGSPPRMPAFDNLTDDQVKDISAFVRSQNVAAGGRAPLVAIVVGDPQAGEEFFNGAGKCNTCHSVTGDLQGIGSKYDVLTLQGRIVLPRGKGGWPNIISPFEVVNPPDVPKKVTVTEPDGTVTTGDMISISDFDVVLRDASGIRHTFARNGDVPKIVLTDPLQAHIDLIKTLTDKEMHDLTAYLVTLK